MDADLAVVGCGPVGRVTAGLLASRGGAVHVEVRPDEHGRAAMGRQLTRNYLG
jgi:2-polyprenyl-6-methoxyphenol hydroxylase-like FAD-dependent oxidoreductase